jgi:crotonobetainyl-CoA:carnitine CoA-transferase CaiB-like acyl-CoA transferase
MDGVKVIELASWTFVPSAGAVMADWGADVLKIEHPTSGDPQRALVIGGLDNKGVNFMMEIANRGKRSVAIDLSTSGGLEVLYKLVTTADIFLTNFLPDTRERLKVDVDTVREINPKIIYAVGSGFGPKGPDGRRAGYDGTAYWARGSVAHQLTPTDRDWPIDQTPAVGDLPGGMTIAGAISAALFHRERTGQAVVVDVSLLATAMWAMAPGIVQAGIYGSKASRRRDRHQNTNPISLIYPTKDGRFLKLSMLESDRWWPELCRHLDRSDLIDDPRFISSGARSMNSAACVEELDTVFRSRSLDEWRQSFATMKAPWGAVQNPGEVLADPQALANGYVQTVGRSSSLEYPLIQSPAQFDEEFQEMGYCPEHGEHTDEVLQELGYDWDSIIELKLAGAVA